MFIWSQEIFSWTYDILEKQGFHPISTMCENGHSSWVMLLDFTLPFWSSLCFVSVISLLDHFSTFLFVSLTLVKVAEVRKALECNMFVFEFECVPAGNTQHAWQPNPVVDHRTCVYLCLLATLEKVWGKERKQT